MTPGLFAFILVSKFCDAILFSRPEKQFARIGVVLSHGDFCHWAAAIALKCDPLMEIFLEQIRKRPVAQMDETRMQVGREANRMARSSGKITFTSGAPSLSALISARAPLKGRHFEPWHAAQGGRL